MEISSMEFLPDLTAEAADRVLARWRTAYPEAGVLALVPEAEKTGVERLQRACLEAAVPLVGAIFPALLDENGFVGRGAWLLRLDRMPYVALYPDLPPDEGLTKVLDGIAEALAPRLGDGDDLTLFMIFDAMVHNIGSILDELYLRLANRVYYLGANAGSETFQPMPCLFDGERVVGNGLLVMLLEPHCGGVLEHGYAVPERMITATSTEGNRIIQIDWRPAFEVYQELVRSEYAVEVTRENFYRNAVHFPFGIVRANGITLVRIPVALDEDGSLFCVGEVPANAVLTLLRAPEVDSRRTLETVVEGLTELNGPIDGRDLLLFYCAGRRLHLGLQAGEGELRGLAATSRAGCLAGALSLGEIGSTTQWGYPLFHNATLVATLWDRR